VSDWYAPNQQAVRGDESGPAEEGAGGTERIDPDEPVKTVDLDEMTKDELLEYAEVAGVEVPSGATKAEVREALEA
jgi:hypothetical protein